MEHASQNNIIITQWEEPVKGSYIGGAACSTRGLFFGFIHNIGICTTSQHCVVLDLLGRKRYFRRGLDSFKLSDI